MTLSAVVDTNLARSDEAGASLGDRIRDAFDERPDAVILFASPRYDFPPLLKALDAACHPRILVGSSSAGEFTSKVNGEGMACAVALRAHEMQFAVGVGRRLGVDRPGAVQILSNKPLGIGVRHGWLPSGDPLRVTQAELRVPLSVNADSSVQCATEIPAGSAVRIMNVSTAAAAQAAGESARGGEPA